MHEKMHSMMGCLGVPEGPEGPLLNALGPGKKRLLDHKLRGSQARVGPAETSKDAHVQLRNPQKHSKTNHQQCSPKLLSERIHWSARSYVRMLQKARKLCQDAAERRARGPVVLICPDTVCWSHRQPAHTSAILEDIFSENEDDTLGLASGMEGKPDRRESRNPIGRRMQRSL